MRLPTRPHCPKCTGQLLPEQDRAVDRWGQPDWACLQCGWRAAYTPQQFARRFGRRLVEEAPAPARVG